MKPALLCFPGGAGHEARHCSAAGPHTSLHAARQAHGPWGSISVHVDPGKKANGTSVTVGIASFWPGAAGDREAAVHTVSGATIAVWHLFRP